MIMTSLQLQAPAKVNLSLHVIGRRPDGYHLLRMVNVPLTLHDRITVTTSPSATSEIQLTCDRDDLGPTDENLCVRAARVMQLAAKRTDAIQIDLQKVIPVGAGLGGGSSNAAAVLKGLNRLWGLDWSPQQLAQLGEPLGADIPFFCYEGPARVGGIGERVEQYQSFPDLYFLLVNPRVKVDTALIFKAYALELTSHNVDGSTPPFLQRFEDVTGILRNDLEAITMARVPEIRSVKRQLSDAGADGVLMSGSGATVFGVFRDAGARDWAYDVLDGTPWWRCKTEVYKSMSHAVHKSPMTS